MKKVLCAVFALVMSTPASASVTYSFIGTESFFNFMGLFEYTSPTSISSDHSVASGDLDSCGVLPETWSCASVSFMPSSANDTIVFYATRSDGTQLGFTFDFARGTFGAPGGWFSTVPGGDYLGTLSITRTSDAVPEPATWATMIFGFGSLGFAMRRRRARGIMQLA